MLRTLRLVLLVSSISVALVACGNKGPLVLPDKAPEQQDKDKDKKKDQPANATQPAAQSSTDGVANQH
jgi:predicted small lipoprotein YifL